MLDLVHLRYFQVIARCGSLTAAARELRVSQPTLTHAVQSLEAQLRTTLLHRGRDGVRLTETGKHLLQHATECLALLERCEQEIIGMQEEATGQFALGCHESLGAYFLPGFMKRFLEEAPNIVLNLWNGTSDAVRTAVLSREVHYGLAVNPLPHPELVLVPLFHDAVDIFTIGETAETLEAARLRLKEGPLIYAGRVWQSRELLKDLGELDCVPGRLLACGDLELVKSLTLAGLGVGLLPRRVAAYGQQGKLHRLHPSLPFIPDEIKLLFRADLPRTRAAVVLKEALVAFGRELDAERGNTSS